MKVGWADLYCKLNEGRMKGEREKGRDLCAKGAHHRDVEKITHDMETDGVLYKLS